MDYYIGPLRELVQHIVIKIVHLFTNLHIGIFLQLLIYCTWLLLSHI